MATSFFFNCGVNIMNGMTASSTILNAMVNSATISSSSASTMVSFDVNANAADMPFQYPQTGFNFNNTGSSYHSTARGMTIADASASTQMVIGQASGFGLQLGWNYNATSANASAYMQTIGQASPVYHLGGLGFDRALALITSVASSNSYTINFTTQVDGQTYAISSGATFAATAWVSGGSKLIRLVNASSSTQSLSFPSGWVFTGNPAPTSIIGSKTIVMSIVSWGTSDSNVTASFVTQQ